jgi:hypothetical protein
VDGEADTPQTGDSITPSKKPFKEKQTLFSPIDREVTAKKAQTPDKQLTSAMANKMLPCLHICLGGNLAGHPQIRVK